MSQPAFPSENSFCFRRTQGEGSVLRAERPLDDENSVRGPNLQFLALPLQYLVTRGRRQGCNEQVYELR